MLIYLGMIVWGLFRSWNDVVDGHETWEGNRADWAKQIRGTLRLWGKRVLAACIALAVLNLLLAGVAPE